jgi:glycosyltransferase involved in cell wall biosynthesis
MGAVDFYKDRVEIIFVDDGSRDDTVVRVKEICRIDKRIRLIILERNFGQSAALLAGFKFARGEIIVSMDGDLQFDPRDIPKMLTEIKKGYDLISAFRRKRNDKLFTKILPSILANRIGRIIFNLRIHDFTSSFMAYRHLVADRVIIFNGGHRFLPILAKLKGFSIGEVAVSVRKREMGESKYTFFRILKAAKDIISLELINLFGKNGLSFVNFKEASFEIKEII